MKGTIISTNHTVVINEKQIDLWFNLERGTLQAFIDGVQILDSTYQPTRQSFNYINILEVCSTLLENHEEKLRRLLKLEEDEE